jgi:hypothetical protein
MSTRLQTGLNLHDLPSRARVHVAGDEAPAQFPKSLRKILAMCGQWGLLSRPRGRNTSEIMCSERPTCLQAVGLTTLQYKSGSCAAFGEVERAGT